MLPNVTVQKIDFQTGVVKPSDVGILAIIAASSMGPENVPTSCVDPGDAVSEFGEGPLPEYASYEMSIAGKQSVLIRSAASTAGAVGTITKTGTGTSAITAGATAPVDDFDARVTFVAGGTVGTAGVTFTYNLSGGDPTAESAVQALGTANTIVLPNTGITLDLAAGTVVAGDAVTFTTTRPAPNASDVSAALLALQNTTLPWESVLIDIDADASIVALCSTWKAARNAEGLFPQIYLNTARKLASQTDSAYQTQLATIASSNRDIDVVFGADGGDITSTISGATQGRPASLIAAARVMGLAVGVEPAYVALGPLQGVSIVDDRGNPKFHNEAKSPGLDDLGFLTLRTFSGPNGQAGAFITNGRLFSPSGSDYQFIPQGRSLNLACGIAYQLLITQLSKGLAKNPKVGPNGARYIAEYEAQRIEALVNSAVNRALAGQVDQFKFSVSRTDDISSNGGATISCTMQVVALAYAKQFNVTAGFVKSVS